MYNIMKKVILNKVEPAQQIEQKLNVFLKTNRITKQQYDELLNMINSCLI